MHNHSTALVSRRRAVPSRRPALRRLPGGAGQSRDEGDSSRAIRRPLMPFPASIAILHINILHININENRVHGVGYLDPGRSPSYLPCVWTYRDRPLEKDQCFPAKLSKSGPNPSKRIVGRPRPLVELLNGLHHRLLCGRQRHPRGRDKGAARALVWPSAGESDQ